MAVFHVRIVLSTVITNYKESKTMEYLQMFCVLAVAFSFVAGVMIYFNDEQE